MKKFISRIMFIALSCYIVFSTVTHIVGIPKYNNDENVAKPFFILEEEAQDK